MVSFRLSDEEYQRLADLCVNSNARSLSDVAREAVHYWMRSTDAQPPARLEDRVAELEQRIEHIAAMITHPAAVETGE